MELIQELTSYAISRGLAYPDDYAYFANLLARYLGLEVKTYEMTNNIREINEIIEDIVKLKRADALYIAEMMNLFVDKPSSVVQEFNHIYNNEGPVSATDWYYEFAKNTYYLKDKLREIIKDTTDLELELTSLKEEEIDFTSTKIGGKEANLRVIPQFINGKRFFIEYARTMNFLEEAYVYSMVKESSYTVDTIKNMLGFIDKFNHYFITATLGKEVTYLAGHHEMPIEKAKPLQEWQIGEVKIQHLTWPITTLRLKSDNKEDLARVAIKLISNLDSEVYLACRFMDTYELDVCLVNTKTNILRILGIGDLKIEENFSQYSENLLNLSAYKKEEGEEIARIIAILD